MISGKHRLSPGLRGAIFYTSYWGIIGITDPFINVYLDKIGLSGPQIGWLSALFPLFAMALPLFVSRAADRMNRRVAILTVTALAYGIALIVFPFPRTFLAILVGMVALAVFRSPIAPLADGLVAKMSDVYRIDYGRMRMWGSLGFTLTAIGLASLWQLTGYPIMFFCGGFLFLGVVAAASLLDEVPSPPRAVVRTRLPIFSDRGMLILLGATLLLGIGMSMGGTFSGIYMARLGGTPMQIGAILGISALFEVPAMGIGKKVFQRLGGTWTLLLGYSLVIVSFTGYALAASPWMLLAVTGFKGFGFGLYYVSTVTMINERAPEGLYTTYQSIMYTLGWGIAPLIGSPLSGILFDGLGPSKLFIIAAAVVFAAIVLILPTFTIWQKELATARIILAGEENVPGSNA